MPASPATGETTTAFGTSHDTAADGTGQTGGLAASNIGARELGDSKREMGKEVNTPFFRLVYKADNVLGFFFRRSQVTLTRVNLVSAPKN